MTTEPFERGMVQPVWLSPDGKWIAHLDRDTDRVCLTPIRGQSGGGCATIPDFGPYTAAWKPDSSGLVSGADLQQSYDTDTSIVNIDGSWRTLNDDDGTGKFDRAVHRVVANTTWTAAGGIVGIGYGPDLGIGVVATVDPTTGREAVLATIPEPYVYWSTERLVTSGTEVIGFVVDNASASEAMMILDPSTGEIMLVDVPNVGDSVAARYVADATDHLLVVGLGALSGQAGANRGRPFFEIIDRRDLSIRPVEAGPESITYFVVLSPDGRRAAVGWGARDLNLRVSIVDTGAPVVTTNTPTLEVVDALPATFQGLGSEAVRWTDDDHIVFVGTRAVYDLDATKLMERTNAATPARSGTLEPTD